jgi:putative lipoic acid-binding regulatory protein
VTESLLKFPCDFPLKIMGRDSQEFRDTVKHIVEKHTGPIDPAGVEERPSKNGNYIGLTYTVLAQGQQQLDDLYRELTSCKAVLVVL